MIISEVDERTPLISTGPDADSGPISSQRLHRHLACWSELLELIKLSIPVILHSMLFFVSGLTNLMFCAKLSITCFAAASLANSTFNMGGAAVVFGLSMACDTLFAQTYGSGDFDLLGIHLQKALVIIFLCCLPSASLFLLIEPILLAMGQNERISRLTSVFLLRMLPNLWLMSFNNVLSKFLQAQNQTLTPLICGVVGVAFNALFHYMFLLRLKIGIIGSAIAQNLSAAIQALLLLICIVVSRTCRQSYSGYRKELWDDWGKWFKIGIPSLLIVSLEWWFSEIGAVFAGLFGEVELSSQSILFNLDSLIYTMIPIGVGTAASIRIGQSLGRERSDLARITSFTTLIFIGFTSVLTATIVYFARRLIPKAFTDDDLVYEMTADVLKLTAVNLIFDGFNGASSGICRGVGLQKWGALNMFISLYVIGLPISSSLVFKTSMGLKGIWTGMIVGGAVQATVYQLLIYSLNWEREVQRAKVNTSMDLDEPAEIAGPEPNDGDASRNEPDVQPEDRPMQQTNRNLVAKRAFFMEMSIKSLCTGVLYRCVYFSSFYLFLISFFTGYMHLFMYFHIDRDHPRLTGPSSCLGFNPGLSIVPCPDSDNSLIRLSSRSILLYEGFTSELLAFSAPYQRAGDRVEMAQCARNDGSYVFDIERPCSYDLDAAWPCNVDSVYGYDGESPCIVLKMNRIYGWLPDPVEGANGVLVKCEGATIDDQVNMGEVSYFDLEQYYEAIEMDSLGRQGRRISGGTWAETRAKGNPYNGTFHMDFFPYVNQRWYLQPLVWVVFHEMKRDTLTRVQCYLIAKNIHVDFARSEGSVKFEILVE